MSSRHPRPISKCCCQYSRRCGERSSRPLAVAATAATRAQLARQRTRGPLACSPGRQLPQSGHRFPCRGAGRRALAPAPAFGRVLESRLTDTRLAMAATTSGRAAPNILVTGTPGTGKSTLAEALADRLGFRHVDIGALVRAARRAWAAFRPAAAALRVLVPVHALSPGVAARCSPDQGARLPLRPGRRVCDPGGRGGGRGARAARAGPHLRPFRRYPDPCAAFQLLDELEPVAEKGGVVMDYHSNDFFPQRFFDLVLVLRTDNTVLFDRLKARCGRSRQARENPAPQPTHPSPPPPAQRLLGEEGSGERGGGNYAGGSMRRGCC